jgi:putative two-component system response regulator
VSDVATATVGEPALAGDHVELIDAIQRLSLARSMADVQAIVRGAARWLTGADGELEQVRIESLQRLALAVEMRDAGTHEHTARVARTALRIAQQLSLAEPDAAWIGQAAPLHDVGKLSVPESILLKPGRLTGTEFEQIKSHTTTGGAILAGSRSNVLRCAEKIARSHHERWDGSGYPDGLRRDQIPLSARIVAVADVFDALTHARSYKLAWPAGEAAAEIDRLEGNQFDPEVVAAFQSLDSDSLVDLVAA